MRQLEINVFQISDSGILRYLMFYIDCEAPVVYYDNDCDHFCLLLVFMHFQAFHNALHAHAFSQAHPVV